MHLNDVLAAFQYKVTNGGPDSEFAIRSPESESRYKYYLDAINASEKYSGTVIFAKNNPAKVYRVTVIDNLGERCYCWYNTEIDDPIVAKLPENWIMLDHDFDFIEKATAIVRGEPYDERVVIQLTLSDEEFLKIAMAAHMENVTFNEFVNNALRMKIDELKNSGSL